MNNNVMVAAQMILESFPARTIEFFIRTLPLFCEDSIVSCKDMAECYGCTPQAAAKHVAVLTTRGYLLRIHYRAWKVNSNQIKRSV